MVYTYPFKKQNVRISLQHPIYQKMLLSFPNTLLVILFYV